MLTITKHNRDALEDTLSDGSTVEHDCYADDTMSYTVETYTYYRPTQEQMDRGTDHDETGHMAVCDTCKEDMPHIDLSDYGMPDPDDYYEEDR